MIKFKCIFCGWECTETKKVHESICDHLMQCHEMDFRSYYELIKQYKANNKKTGLVVLWVKLRKVGYTRSVQRLYHVMKRIGIYEKAPSKKNKQK
jgi:hypothetical protein